MSEERRKDKKKEQKDSDQRKKEREKERGKRQCAKKEGKDGERRKREGAVREEQGTQRKKVERTKEKSNLDFTIVCSNWRRREGIVSDIKADRGACQGHPELRSERIKKEGRDGE